MLARSCCRVVRSAVPPRRARPRRRRSTRARPCAGSSDGGRGGARAHRNERPRAAWRAGARGDPSVRRSASPGPQGAGRRPPDERPGASVGLTGTDTTTIRVSEPREMLALPSAPAGVPAARERGGGEPAAATRTDRAGRAGRPRRTWGDVVHGPPGRARLSSRTSTRDGAEPRRCSSSTPRTTRASPAARRSRRAAAEHFREAAAVGLVRRRRLGRDGRSATWPSTATTRPAARRGAGRCVSSSRRPSGPRLVLAGSGRRGRPGRRRAHPPWAGGDARRVGGLASPRRCLLRGAHDLAVADGPGGSHGVAPRRRSRHGGTRSPRRSRGAPRSAGAPALGRLDVALADTSRAGRGARSYGARPRRTSPERLLREGALAGRPGRAGRRGGRRGSWTSDAASRRRPR